MFKGVPWLAFVAMTVVMWGAYVPIIHEGQTAFQPKGPLRAFLFVSMGYVIAATLVLGLIAFGQAESMAMNTRAVTLSTFAGILGAGGALGIVFALQAGGKPLVVPPLVFAGAPIVNTLVAMLIHRPEKMPDIRFFLGIVIAAAGASMVLRFKP